MLSIFSDRYSSKPKPRMQEKCSPEAHDWLQNLRVEHLRCSHSDACKAKAPLSTTASSAMKTLKTRSVSAERVFNRFV